MEFNLNKAYSYYVDINNISEAVRQHCEELGIEYSEKYRNRLSRAIRKGEFSSKNTYEEKIDEKDSYEEESSFNMPSAWDAKANKFLDLKEYCEKYNLPYENVKYGKLVSHNQSHINYNILFKEELISEENGFTEEKLSEIVKRHSNFKTYEHSLRDNSSNVITRLVYTDTHVSMNPNPDGQSLYGGVWNKDELFKRLNIIVENIVEEANKNNSSTLIIDDLGDFNDNLNGQTERGGHGLEANMSNLEMFETGVDFKITMVDLLVASKQFNYIILNNVCNSNHTALVDSFTNSMTKRILEEKYKDVVRVNNNHKTFSHYVIDNHVFVLGHGKNKDTNKFGMKYIPGTKEISKVDEYLKMNGLYQKGKYFHFSKGDSHIANFNYGEDSNIDYFSYPALSPSSRYIQDNFQAGRSGFVVETFNGNERGITQKIHWFNWEK